MHMLSIALCSSYNSCNSALTQLQQMQDASLIHAALCCLVCALLFVNLSLLLTFQKTVSQWCCAATKLLYRAVGDW